MYSNIENIGDDEFKEDLLADLMKGAKKPSNDSDRHKVLRSDILPRKLRDMSLKKRKKSALAEVRFEKWEERTIKKKYHFFSRLISLVRKRLPH